MILKDKKRPHTLSTFFDEIFHANHNNYSFLKFDWCINCLTIKIVIGLKNPYFPLIHLSSCYRTVQ